MNLFGPPVPGPRATYEAVLHLLEKHRPELVLQWEEMLHATFSEAYGWLGQQFPDVLDKSMLLYTVPDYLAQHLEKLDER